MFVLGVIIFIIIGVIDIVQSFYFNDKPWFVGLIIALFLGAFFTCVGAENNTRNAKVEALSKVGLVELTDEEVYNKSQAELDKCYSVITIDKVHYYLLSE